MGACQLSLYPTMSSKVGCRVSSCPLQLHIQQHNILIKCRQHPVGLLFDRQTRWHWCITWQRCKCWQFHPTWDRNRNLHLSVDINGRTGWEQEYSHDEDDFHLSPFTFWKTSSTSASQEAPFGKRTCFRFSTMAFASIPCQSLFPVSTIPLDRGKYLREISLKVISSRFRRIRFG